MVHYILGLRHTVPMNAIVEKYKVHVHQTVKLASPESTSSAWLSMPDRQVGTGTQTANITSSSNEWLSS